MARHPMLPLPLSKHPQYAWEFLRELSNSLETLSVAMPADSRCEQKIEIAVEVVFEIAGAKL